MNIDPAISITGIKFNYLSSSDTSLAIPVTLPTTPEWPPQRVTTPVFPLEQVRDNEVSIEICFKAQLETLLNKWLKVRAIRMDGPEPGCVITEGEITIGSDYFSASEWDYGYLSFKLNKDALWEPMIGRYPSEWQWQYQYDDANASEEGWINLEITLHEIFITLDLPGWPWSAPGSSIQGIPPRLDFLQVACTFAAGTTDAVTAAQSITQGIYNSGLFDYDEYSNYTGALPLGLIPSDETDSEHEINYLLFKGTDSHERILGLFGQGSKVNCTDLSYLVLLIGNSLGCGLNTVKIKSSVGDIQLNPAQPIGESYVRTEFSQHEFLWMGDQFDDQALIFDASLGFDEDNPSEEYSLCPVAGLPFGDQGELKGYLTRLAACPEDISVQDPEIISLRIS